ncbi:MAG: hypothetical protein IJ634_07265 [Bacteroidales bacterium]|nr:hypothetical protein [Bacteroidales bacterium]
MKYKIGMLLLVAAMAMVQGEVGAQTVKFSKYFTGGTLRLDCSREGNAEGDTVWVSRWLDRSADWHGSRTVLIDPFDNGDYRVEMRDAKSGKVLYSKGYSNLFREYKGTAKGKKVKARFEETLLLPMPKRKVNIALQRRDEHMKLVDQTVVPFDPGERELDFNYHIGVRTDLELHGDPQDKVDVVIVAQGYDSDSDPQLRVDYYRMKEILFGQKPFKNHRNDFNVYGVKADVDAEFGTFGIDRYLMTFSLWKLHDALGTTPCDYIIIMVNSDTYGGGAIYNFYAVTSMHRLAEYVLPHEFGHSFGGLADEYVDEDLAYGNLHINDYEPLEPNITNLKAFDRKWKSMLPAEVKIPTPENQDVPRSECGPLGVYEGAGYANEGVYRPAMRCMMRDYAPFCPVCAKRLEEVFSLYLK